MDEENTEETEESVSFQPNSGSEQPVRKKGRRRRRKKPAQTDGTPVKETVPETESTVEEKRAEGEQPAAPQKKKRRRRRRNSAAARTPSSDEITQEEQPAEPMPDTEEDDLSRTQQITTFAGLAEDNTLPENMTEEKPVKSSLIDRLLRPVTVIERSARGNTVLSVLCIACAIGVSVLPFVYKAAGLLNEEAFSYVRMTFSDASLLWFKLTLFLFAGIAAADRILTLLVYKADFGRLLRGEGAAAPACAAAFLLAGLVNLVSFPAGVVCVCAAFVYTTMLQSEAVRRAGDVSDERLPVLMLVRTLIAAGIFMLIFSLFDTDLLMIMRALFPFE